MKRYLFIFLAVAAMAASCAKTEIRSAREDHAITFIAANYATKAPEVTGSVFPTSESFGVYAWTDGTEGTYFMDDEVVSFVAAESLWKPSTTYYWPKYATVDFFCFYPTSLDAYLTPGETQFTISGFDAVASQVDVMYADKAVGFTDNQDLVSDGVNGYTGVPAFFRHALAKIKVNVVLPYYKKTADDGTEYEWTVSVKNFSLNNVYGKGDVTLDLSDLSATGRVAWNKPAGNVWTPDGSTTSFSNPAVTELSSDAPYVVLDETYVLPQNLSAGAQQISLDITIATKRNGAAFLTENVSRTIDLCLPDISLTAWEMNHLIVYNIILTPTASTGNGGTPYDPTDPSDPDRPDPEDPDLDDVTITFDPAVDDWDPITITGSIAI